MGENDISWNSWSRHVLAELERLNDCTEGINAQLGKIHVEIAMLKVKSGIWGAIGGCIPVIVTLIIAFLVKK